LADILSQLIQLLGSLLVLAGFVGAQRGVFVPTSKVYLVLNLLGSGTLAVLAAMDRQVGFLVLEGTWAVVSGYSLIPKRGRKPVGSGR
jgi:hypothetical protein